MDGEKQVPGEAPPLPRVAVVGAGLAGTRLVKNLRRRGFEGRISLFGDEEGPPYDRPPLTKSYLTSTAAPEPTVLLTPPEIETLDVDFRPGTTVHARGELITDPSGTVIDADLVVVATGARPRRLPGQPSGPRIHTIRTREQASRLRKALSTSRSLLVVGGGLLGGEVTTAARAWGLETSVVEADHTPFLRALGQQAAWILTELHRSQGVTFHLESRVSNWTIRDSSVSVTLNNTAEIIADHVVVSVGATANTGWLGTHASTPLDLDQDGRIRCDSHGRVLGRPHWFAVGDAAHWVTPGDAHPDQMQHWNRTVDQAEVVAVVICAGCGTASVEDIPPLGIPYVWTTQAGRRIHCLGELGKASHSALFSTRDGESIVIAERDGLVVAVTLIGLPRLVALARELVREAIPMTSIADRLAATPYSFSLVDGALTTH
jgi:NADPH-dependent 2,4-dienoyl-CoA reductase/sulfur reductase-like enzyme